MSSDRLVFESQELILTGRVVTPDNGEIEAGILCITGGGVTGCDENYLDWQRFMAEEAGLASLAFNARGIDGSEGAWRTDSEDYDQDTAPANSQASRVADTLVAYDIMKTVFGITDDAKIGIIGASMGGDILAHALDELRPGAAVLRAPSAYPDEAHDIEYGPAWGATINGLGGSDSALGSSNFERIPTLQIPLLLSYSVGEEVIPGNIQESYEVAVRKQGGQVHWVGDEGNKHLYLSASNNKKPENAAAAQETFKTVTAFFEEKLLSRQ